jgi:DNA-binding MarR family transcriptional regulator
MHLGVRIENNMLPSGDSSGEHQQPDLFQEQVSKVDWFLIHLLRIFDLGRNIKIQDIDFSISQAKALSVFEDGSEFTMTELSNHLKVSLPTATEMVDRLVKAKLVTRKRSKNDRRVVMVALSPFGRRIKGEFLQHKRNIIEEVLIQLPEKEREDLVKAMERTMEIFDFMTKKDQEARTIK